MSAKGIVRTMERGTQIVITCHSIRGSQFQQVHPFYPFHELFVENLPRYRYRREPAIFLAFEKFVSTIAT